MSGNQYEFELGKAADILCRELVKVKPDETVLITGDTLNDRRVMDAVARAAFACGGKPMMIINAYPGGCGKDGDKNLPLRPLTAALKEADVWIEFNEGWLLYSTPYDIAFRENKKLRAVSALAMTADSMVRCIGNVDNKTLKQFMERIHAMTKNGKHFKFTAPAGTDVEFDNSDNPNRIYTLSTGYADWPNSHMVAGQISWTPEFDTINGVIVFDGSIDPVPGPLSGETVSLTVQKGKVVDIKGGKAAQAFHNWLFNYDDPQMRILAHTSWGLNPGAKICGVVVEDERVWGCTQWGLGNIGAILIRPDGIPGASHCDGICLDTSAWIDGVQVFDKGKVVHKDLIELAKRLGKA